MKNIYEDLKVDLVILNAAADNQTLTPAAPLDMQGYEGIAFHVAAQQGEVGAFTLKGQQGAQADGSDAADLAGTGVAFATAVAADGEALLDIYRPQKRYVQPAVVVPDLVAAKAVSVVAVRYGARSKPQVNTTGELHVSPSEGAA